MSALTRWTVQAVEGCMGESRVAIYADENGSFVQHDALAAHVAAEVAKARAEDAAMIAQLEQDLADANSGADDAYRRGYWAGGNGA